MTPPLQPRSSVSRAEISPSPEARPAAHFGPGREGAEILSAASSVLLKMAVHGSAAGVRDALAAGGDIFARDRLGRTPLAVAVGASRPGAFDALLPLGGIDEQDHAGLTPLVLASRGGNLHCARRLLESGANSALGPAARSTPLMHAANAAMAKLLLPASDPKARCALGRDALMWAALDNRADCARVLLDACDPLLFDAEGENALSLALQGGSRTLARAIFKRTGPEVFRRKGAELIFRALEGGDSRHFAVFWILEHSDARGWVDSQGSTALIRAAQEAPASILRALIPASDPNAQDEAGFTALMHAMLTPGRAAAFDALLPLSDLALADGDGWTPLILSANNGLADFLEALLPGSDANARDGQGRCAIHRAAFYGHARCVELLMPRSDPSLRSAEGESLLDVASDTQQWECADLAAQRPEWASETEIRELARWAQACKSEHLIPRTRARIEALDLAAAIGRGPRASEPPKRTPPRSL